MICWIQKFSVGIVSFLKNWSVDLQYVSLIYINLTICNNLTVCNLTICKFLVYSKVITCRLFQDIEYSSLCYIVGSCCFIHSSLYLEKAMAPHSSTLAWKIPWTEEPGGLQSMGSLSVRHIWVTLLSLFTFTH